MRFLSAAIVFVSMTSTLWAQVYIHNTAPHVYGNAIVNQSKGTLRYYSVNGERIEIPLSEVSKESKERINGIKRNEVAILNGKLCQAFYVAESGRAQFTCRSGIVYTDSIYGKTHHLEKFVAPTSEAIGEVQELEGMKKKDFVTLQVPVEHIQAGEEVRIEAILANGEVLIKRTGFMRMGLIQSGGSEVRDISTVRAHITDLCKCNP